MQIRAFVKNKEGMAQQELNQSPLPFVESASQPGTPLTHALAPAQVHRLCLDPYVRHICAAWAQTDRSGGMQILEMR